jgi:hypothetical protein
MHCSLRDIDRGFDERLRQNTVEIDTRRRKQSWCLLLNRNDRPQPIPQRREIPLHVLSEVDGLSVGHRIPRVGSCAFKTEDFASNRREKDLAVEQCFGTQFAHRQITQTPLEFLQALQFRIERRAAEVCNTPVVFVQA